MLKGGLKVVYDFTARALHRVSPIYANSNFIRNFYKAVGEQFDLARPYFESFHEQSFNGTVTWAIGYREDMYSLDRRPDLSLEERRARLKLKTAVNLPLNPAILEKAILDNFNFITYLSERTAGYINLIFNYTTPDAWRETIKFLLREKPAHLALMATWHNVVYIGDDDDTKGDDDKPGELYPEDDDVRTPKSFDDRKFFPRIFFGTATVCEAENTIEPYKIKNTIGRLKAGVGLGAIGVINQDIRKPHNELIELHAGIGILIGGEITIGEIAPFTAQAIKENPLADLLIVGRGIAR